MRVAQTGIIQKVYRDETGFYAVEVRRTETKTKGITRYVGFKTKPKVKVGQRIKSGDEL